MAGVWVWLGAVLLASVASASDLDEFRVKRESVFEFIQKPRITREGDSVTVEFESKAFCDATVAIEDTAGPSARPGRAKIVRHLASGVLGPNAPEPFQKNSLKQRLVWDGKNDKGEYVDARGGVVVRVSLGLKAQFERTLFWSPHKRIGSGQGGDVGTTVNLPVPRIAAAPEGVYVFEGEGVDHLRLFDHGGNYVRTVYPFPADAFERVDGLTWAVRPQDGLRLPLTCGHLQGTLLRSGSSSSAGYGASIFGAAATAIAVHNGRIALCHHRMCRLAGDGTSGGLPLDGPAVTVPVHLAGTNIGVGGVKDIAVGPTSAAFSPDGTRLYLGGFLYRDGVTGVSLCRGGINGVARVAFAEDKPMERFAGSLKQGASGRGEGEFTVATSVACDSAGRVYAADYLNDRVQVFSPDGTFLKSIAAPKPARVAVHARSGEIYVFSWGIHNDGTERAVGEVPPTLSRLGPFDDPKKLASYPLPVAGKDMLPVWNRGSHWSGLQVDAALDSWADPPAVWLVSVASGGWDGRHPDGFSNQWDNKNIRVLAVTEDGLKVVRDFGAETKRAVVRSTPPFHWRQRLYVNPRTGRLYIGEGQTGYGDAFYEAVEVEPDTGRQRLVQMPFDSEDLAFDLDGLAYLRTRTIIARYDPAGEAWREVPFDYGEDWDLVGWSASATQGWRVRVISGIAVPDPPYRCAWHLGGMSVSARGNILAMCLTDKQTPLAVSTRHDTPGPGGRIGNGYVPQLYPGRPRQSEFHVWDKYGKLLIADAVPGLALTEGVGLDRDNSIYVLATPPRVLDGKPYFIGKSGTLMKFRPRAARFRTEGDPFVVVPLTAETRPRRRPDMLGPQSVPIWVEGAEWFYGGVGWWGWNSVGEGGGCACWNARFALDEFRRSFAPELDHFSVAVVDSSGNLILRVGRYGNVDDGRPLDKSGGPPGARSIGGDEVALLRPAYVATDTDRRLFIADAGNARVLCVKFCYHAEEKVALKEVPEKR